MNKQWQGLDFLRGLGIMGLLAMHSAFYYYGGIWTIDLDNPPLIITVIGLLLMFAGLFAMISGCVHGISMMRLEKDRSWSASQILKKKLVSAIFMLCTAYLYFIFTGPGLSDFSTRTMNNSILVELIRNGRLIGTNPERLFYIDSLVMIASNILLISLIWTGLRKLRLLRPGMLLGLSGVVMLLTLIRLPLYPLYLELFATRNWFGVLGLFWLVNKNNPVLPFLAFGLMGAWLAFYLEQGRSKKLPLLVGLSCFLAGVISYVFLPDTMLERAIDLKWYSIMVAQIGLFILLILGSIRLLDPSGGTRDNPFMRFFKRFSYGGLTAFFLESIVAAIVWRLLRLIWPDLELSLGGALFYGLILAICWGFILMLWEKRSYRGTLESGYGRLVARFGGASSKAEKLRSIDRM